MYKTDKRIPKMQEMLENVMSNVQSLHVQSTAGNVEALYEIIVNLQVVYNTLDVIQKEQPEDDPQKEDEEDEREADPQ